MVATQEITKVTTKGQVVIPSAIRKVLNLSEGSQLAVSSIGDFVLMRKMEIPDLKKEFEALTKFGEAFARGKGIRNEEDVIAIIQKGRAKRKSSH